MSSVCPTGISGLDDLLNGGIPRGNIVLVAGTPGAGKTTMAAKFIYEGLRCGEPGVYLSFLESKTDFLRFMKLLGMDFEPYVKSGMFQYIEGLQSTTFEAARENLIEFLDAVARIGARRVVIDSITAITQMTTLRGARELVKNALVLGLRPYEVTGLIVAELPIGYEVVGYGLEEFIFDGVIILKSEFRNGILRRTLQVRKMRGTVVPEVELHYDIVPGDGIRVYAPVRIEEIEGSGRAESITPLEPVNRVFRALRKGSQVLLIVDKYVPSLAVGVLAGLAFAYSSGGKLLIRSFSKPPDTVKHIIDLVSSTFPKDLRAPTEVIIECLNPTQEPLYRLAHRSRDNELKVKPDYLVVDPVSHLLKLSGSIHEFCRDHINNILMRRKLGITTFYVYANDGGDGLELPVELYDVIARVRRKWGKPGRCYVVEAYGMLKPAPPSPVTFCVDPEWRLTVVEE